MENGKLLLRVWGLGYIVVIEKFVATIKENQMEKEKGSEMETGIKLLLVAHYTSRTWRFGAWHCFRVRDVRSFHCSLRGALC